MSRTIDTRVVELEFDNKRFEDNVKVSSSTLNQFKDSLDLDGVANNLSVSSAIITGALLKIGAQVVETGAQIAKAITLDPIIQGLSSYEKQIQSVQVIMNATGDTMSHVEGVMSRLSWFADETSYSMDQMTNAASRFVSNNLPLSQSATAIQGIATMAALAGVSGQRAAIAFNNMADAVAKGGLSAIDYKSLELAGITTTEFKKTAIEAAIAMGTLSKNGEILNGKMKGVTVTVENFKETLSEQASGMWFSNEVIMAQAEAFGKYATEVHRVQEELGVTANRAMEIITETMGADWESLGKKAFLAAQESKTLTDSINYTKDALASGWAATWKIVLGNYEEAKIVFTGLSDLLYHLFVASGDARNEILSIWKDDGGRQAFLESLDYLINIIKRSTAPIREAFGEIFPSSIEGTAKKLVQLTEKVRDTLKNFSMTKETAENLRKTFSGLFSMADIGITFFKSLATFAKNVVKLFLPATSSVLKLTGGFGEFITKIRDTIKDGQMFEKFFDTLLSGLIKMKDILSPVTTALSDGLSLLGDRLGQAGAKIKEIFSDDGGTGGFGDRVKLGLSIVTGYVQEFLSHFDGLLSKVTERIQKFAGVDIGAGFFDTLKGVLNNLPTMEAIVEQIKQFFTNLSETIAKFSPTFKKVWDVAGPILNEFFSSIKNTLGNLDLEKTLQILNSILSIGLVKTLMNLTGAFGDFSKSSTKVMTAFADVLIQVKDSIKAFTWSIKSKAILDIAIAIGILVAALVAMSFVDIAKLGASLGVLTVVIGELLAAFYVLGKVKSELKAGDLMKMSVVFVGLGAAILILANAMVKIAQLKWEQIGKGLSVITLLMAELTIIAKVLGGGKSIASIGASFVALSIALFALIKVLMLYVDTDIDTLAEGLAKTGVAVMALGLSLKTFTTGVNLPSIAAGLLILNLALTGLAGLILLYSKFSLETLVKGLLTIAAGIVTLGLAVKTFKASLAEAGAFAIMAFALGSLAIPLLLLSKLSLADIIKGIIGVAGAAAVLVIGAKALDKKTSANLAALGAALLAFAGGFKVLSVAMKGMDNETFAKTLIAVGGATLLLVALSKAGAHSKGAIASATAMLVVMSGIAAVFHLLATFSNVDAMMEIAKSLSLVMGAMSIMLLAMSNVDSKKVMQAEGTVLALELLLIPLGLVLYGMSQFVENPENLVPIAISLGILMNALSASVLIISNIKTGVATAAIGALALVALVASGVGLVLAGLSHITNAETVIPIAIAIGILMSALSVSIAIMGLIGPLASAAMAALGPMVAVIGVTLSLVMILGELEKYKSQAEAGVEMLALIGMGIGKFIGSIIGGVAAGITSALPQIGQDLTDFIVNAQGFIDGVNQLDSSFLESVAQLAAAIMAITAADLVSSILNFFKGGFESKELAEKLTDLGTALTAFADSTSTIKNTYGVKNSAEAIKILFEALSKAPRSGGLIEKLWAGTNDVDMIGQQLESFGSALRMFYAQTLGIDSGRLNTVSNSMTKLFQALGEAPNSGGLLEEIVGGNTVGGRGVGAQLASFGGYLVEFYNNTKDISPEVLNPISESMTTLFKAMKDAPNDGGVISWFTGNNNVGGHDGVGAQLKAFGGSFKDFFDATKDIVPETITNVAGAMVVLFNSLKEAPNSGGVISWFTGNNDAGNIGHSLADFGNGLYNFSNNVATVSPDRLKTFGEAILVLFTSFKAVNSIASSGFHSVGNFSTQLVTIGKKCAEFAEIMTPEVINVITNSKGAVEAIGEMLTALNNVDVSGKAAFFIGSLTQAIGDSLTSDVSKQSLIIKMEELLEAMLSAFWSPKTDANIIAAVDMMFFPERFESAGQKILEGLALGMKDVTYLTNRCDEIARELARKLGELFPASTVSAGKDFGGGMAAGIDGSKQIVVNAATRMGLYSIEALRKAIDAHSNAEETKKAGEDYGGGYEEGIDNKVPDVKKSAVEMGVESVKSLYEGAKEKVLEYKDGYSFEKLLSTPISDGGLAAVEEAIKGGTEVGKEFTKSTATSIKKEKTAEEAAKEKAQAIVDAFAEGLSGLSRVMERLSLELNIFEKSLGFLSSDDTYSYASREAIVNQKKLETLTQQLAHQQEKIGVTQEKYNKMLAEFGADSTYTKDAYDELRKEQLAALDMQWQIDELRYNSNKKREDILKQGADAEAEYKKRLAETIREYQEQGRQFSLVDLQAKIAKDVGYDPEWRKKLEGVMTQAAVETGKVVSDSYQENVMTGLAGFTGDYTQTGLDYSKALGSGFVSGVPIIASGTAQAMQQTLEIAKHTVEDWYNVGAESIKSFAQAMIDHLPDAIAAGAEIAKAAIDAAIKVLMFGGGSEGGDGVPFTSSGGGGAATIVGQMSEEQKSYAEAVANGTSDAWISAWEKAKKAAENGDITVTVTPVIDMDELKKDIKSGVSDTDLMLPNRSTAAAQKAASASQQKSTNQNGSDTNVNNYNFVQNNTSPKALSRIDIYRNTSNQFSLAKEVVKA